MRPGEGQPSGPHVERFKAALYVAAWTVVLLTSVVACALFFNVIELVSGGDGGLRTFWIRHLGLPALLWFVLAMSLLARRKPQGQRGGAKGHSPDPPAAKFLFTLLCATLASIDALLLASETALETPVASVPDFLGGVRYGLFAELLLGVPLGMLVISRSRMGIVGSAALGAIVAGLSSYAVFFRWIQAVAWV